MRLRNIPGSREVIAESEFVIHEDVMREKKGVWHTVFGNDHPIRLEIGMGKGRFIHEMAALHPEYNYVGIEKYSSVLLRALDKRQAMREAGLPDNLYFLRMDAENLTEVFAPGEADRIYLNFSDPWPKDRHAHRRLPSRAYLKHYRQILTADGVVEFKTDNDDLFAFALEEAKAEGWRILACTMDLHHDPQMLEGNVMTEYEAKFSALGNPIHKVVLGQPEDKE